MNYDGTNIIAFRGITGKLHVKFIDEFTRADGREIFAVAEKTREAEPERVYEPMCAYHPANFRGVHIRKIFDMLRIES